MALIRVPSVQTVLVILFVFTSRVICVFQTDELRKNLVEFVNKVTNFKSMQEEFSNTEGDYIDIDGSELVNGFVTKLEAVFGEKKEKLKRVKDKVEEDYQPHIKNEAEDYPNMREANNETFTINRQFSLKVKVNMSKSFVHVPTNIYARSNKVLSIVEWTKGLDEVFIDNFNKSNKTLLYQYYGHHSGFLRVYPGNNNNAPSDNATSKDQIDLYDCRRRPWYVQSTSSPKDIVIIIDLSGSMIGSKIGIAKIATASLIDTLEENDFFNVISVNKKVHYMEDCLKYLLQATKRNKERMKTLVQYKTLVPVYELNHTMGLETAFDLLNSGRDSGGMNSTRNRSYSYANCNRAIVFITDGIESDYTAETKLFDRYNPEKRTRVFTYLVGRKKSPNKEALVRMACENNGYFYKLETLGNVWDTVLEYLHVMSRSLVQAECARNKTLFTPAYLDSTGLGMVLSISMPVFNSKQDKFIGVAGTDITIKSLNDAVPHAQLATFGHAFIITNNGFIVMHPEFRTQTDANRRLPSPPNILMEDLERAVDSNNIIRVKKTMINRQPDDDKNNRFPVYFVYDNSRKLSITNARYNHRSITDTEFSAGVVQSERERCTFNFQNDTLLSVTLLRNGIRALKVPYVNRTTANTTLRHWKTFVKVSPWNYLNITSAEQENQPHSIKVYPTATEIYEHLKDVNNWGDLSKKVPENFKTELVKNMLVSAAIASTAVHNSWLPENLGNDTYKSLFVATAAGYLRYVTLTNTSEVYDRDVLNNPIFQHALANPGAEVIFSAPYNELHHRYDENWITVVAPIRKNDTVIAVTGMIFKAEKMFEFFKRSAKTCDDKNTEVCALLDRNGYIIASNQVPQGVGSFIGEQSGLLVDMLVEDGVMEVIKLQDTQGDCKWENEHSASANMLMTPAKLILKGLVFIFRTLARTSMHAGIFLISIFHRSGKTSASNTPDIEVSCTKQMQFYLFREDVIRNYTLKNKRKTRICKSNEPTCNLTVEAVELVDGTNLVFLKVKIEDKSNEQCRNQCMIPIPNKVLSRIQIDSNNYCSKNHNNTDAKEKYRRQPMTCFNETAPKPENKKTKNKKYKCGKAGMMRPALLLLIIALIMVFMTM